MDFWRFLGLAGPFWSGFEAVSALYPEVQVVEKVVEVPQLGSTTQGSVREVDVETEPTRQEPERHQKTYLWMRLTAVLGGKSDRFIRNRREMAWRQLLLVSVARRFGGREGSRKTGGVRSSPRK